MNAQQRHRLAVHHVRQNISYLVITINFVVVAATHYSSPSDVVVPSTMQHYGNYGDQLPPLNQDVVVVASPNRYDAVPN